MNDQTRTNKPANGNYIKNLSYSVPTCGRVAMGDTSDASGRRLPTKLDHFVITTQHKDNGEWLQHTVTKHVVAATGVADPSKIRAIPIKLMFDNPDLNVRERYEAYDTEGRMICAGDGETARRRVAGTIETVDCPGKDNCNFGRCRLMTRMNFQIDVEGDNYKPDWSSTFILRSAGFNTAKTLRAKLTALAAAFGGRLTGMPLMLMMRRKSSALSRQSVFYYADVVPTLSPIESARAAKKHAECMAADGWDQAAFEGAIAAGLANGPFEDTAEEFDELESLLIDSEDGVGAGDTPKAQRKQKAQHKQKNEAGDSDVDGQPNSLDWMTATRSRLNSVTGDTPQPSH